MPLDAVVTVVTVLVVVLLGGFVVSARIFDGVRELARRLLRAARRSSGADRLAMLALALAVVTWVAWEWRDHFLVNGFLNAWGPNIGTDLVFIAIGTLVLDRALRRSIENQQKPRRDQVVYSIMWSLYDLEDLLERVYRAWSELPPYSAQCREVIRASMTFSARAAAISVSNQDVLPADLVASINELAAVAREAEQWFSDPAAYEMPGWVKARKSVGEWPKNSDPVREGHDGAMFLLLDAVSRVSAAFRTTTD